MNVSQLIALLLLLSGSEPTGSVGVADPDSLVSALEWRTLPEALAEARADGTPALVYVQAAWCGPCRRLERETFPEPEVASRLEGFALARLTYDDRDRTHRVGPYRLSEAEWASRLGAQATPTFVLLSPDGAVLGRYSGFLPAEGLTMMLDAAISQRPQ